MKIKVLTLNCWGVPVPFVCKNRKERFLAIGTEVGKSSYDIVAFQEVWHKGDFEILKRNIGDTLPYSHYFYSGSIGSGLCLFSKHPILETLYHRFDPNGYCHKIQHGDWFGGKGLGLAKIDVSGTIVHLYITHIHAEYNRERDEYRAHRICQAFSSSQFIKYTSNGAHVSFLCGDLNFEPVDLGYKMICCNGTLKDAWLEKQSTQSEDKEGNTSDCPSNSYSGNNKRDKYPHGKRIDYILYKAGEGISVEIEDCSLTLGRVPGKPFSYSDHEAVEATITVDKKEQKENKQEDQDLSALLQESVSIVDSGLQSTRTNSRFFIAFSVLCLALAYFISVIHIPYPLDYFVTFFKLLLILSMGFGISQFLIMIRSEVHGLEAGRLDMKNLLQNLK
ncbi:putative neutral sphingomyelinase [Mercenaria mercenaria]|uniref:putative neutral sphingomyelinase n=1 Tax=Mercenaria mercenaria TaxID=6596 RepID=UPI00234ECD9E|nr:putative neutral sphingomyelinase [Mercenaria mercenaria]